jgi:hypothetical protein
VKLAHQVWLQHHPSRDVEWLKNMFADGFHVHHIDGDAENNDIDNLVLIDGADHMRLHQRKKLGRPTQVGIRLTKKRLSRIMRQYEEAKRVRG